MFAMNTQYCLGMAAAVAWVSATIAMHRPTGKARVT